MAALRASAEMRSDYSRLSEQYGPLADAEASHTVLEQLGGWTGPTSRMDERVPRVVSG
jgi:hypothetical protein